MSDGDEETDDASAPDAESLGERLDAVEESLGAAETEADLDEVEASLDDVAADLEEADLPEPEDEDEDDPREELEGRVSDLRDELEAQRGPYAEDVVAEIDDAKTTITDTRWTETGEDELVAVVDAFLDEVDDVVGAAVTTDTEADPEALGESLGEAGDAVDSAGLDADDDADTIAALLEATGELQQGVEDAEAYTDLSVREQLQYEGYYDVLGEKHKDYPPEWTAMKEWEKRDNAEMVLLVLDRMGGTDFMERHALDALERMANPVAVDPMIERAGKRDKRAISILGKIGPEAEEALDTILEYAEAEKDPLLQRTTLKALGEIGSEEATQAIADQLVADDKTVRSAAARALGLIGDTRAVEPLAEVVEDDPSDTVRASAAWALYQVGTEAALEAASEYDEDRSYIVQVEAERATDALGA